MSEDAVRTHLIGLREWVEADEPEPEGGWDWPHPPQYTEYRVEGQMRADVLARLGRPADDPCEVRLVEGEIEGGYSEYTIEMDYPVEVWVHEDRQAQKVFETGWDDGLPGFLRWLIEETK